MLPTAWTLRDIVVFRWSKCSLGQVRWPYAGLERMEFATRLCRPGEEHALSLIAQATILETYAGITDGEDLIKYVTAELSVADFRRMLASNRIRAWIAETSARKCICRICACSLR